RRTPRRPDRRAGSTDPRRAQLAAPDRQRVERRRPAGDEARAVPLPVPDRGDRRPAAPAALPALVRRLPRRALQYRELCAAARDACAPVRPATRRVRLDRRRLPPLQQSPRAGAAAARTRAAAASAPRNRAQAPVDRPVRIRRLPFHRLPGASAHRRAGRRLGPVHTTIVPAAAGTPVQPLSRAAACPRAGACLPRVFPARARGPAGSVEALVASPGTAGPIGLP